ncbi:flavin reductase family protein [Arthrobacter sp. GCM10027362]|uniref:flavin reductase family protein n=1 Tax=Arthrobacter sp. GCM10027362 TaxID=3273379 RepID=UPI00363C4B39
MTALATPESVLRLAEPTREQVKAAFSQFPSGVVALAALVEGRPAGFAASSFAAVSMDPALVSVCIQNGSSTWEKLRSGGRIGISILAETQDKAVFQLAGRGDRFSGVDITELSSGAVLIGGASAWLECSLVQEVAAGDHCIALLSVHRLQTEDEIPLVYHRAAVHRLAS